MPKLLDELGVEAHPQGHELRGICPSPDHDDHSPSWMIVVDGDAAGAHHCFACGWGGGPVALVSAVRGIPRKQAWRWLLSFCGVDPAAGARLGHERKIESVAPRRLRYPKETIALWRDVPPEMEEARGYVLGRGFTEDDLKRYAIGAVPEEARRYGGRAIIPVVVDGRMVDFVARLYVDRPKHISKALSGRRDDGATKEWALWNFDELDPSLSTAHVCEGVWGAKAMLNAGIRNVVAACGSDWTAERTALLEPWDRIVLVPDGDPAGSDLVRKASSLRFDHDVLVADLGEGNQPDDLEDDDLLAVVAGASPALFAHFPRSGIRPWTGKR